MLNLDEMQFEILPSVDAADGVGFGIGLDVSIDDGGFDPGSFEWSTQDGTNATRGSTLFGRDKLAGPTWSWAMHVNKDDVPGALQALGKIASAWRGQEIANTPGAVLPIRYRVGDRVRRVYGRPRRFSAPPNNRILGGYIPITADFKCVDSLTYDDAESTAVVDMYNESTGGFQFPVTFPVTTLPSGNREGRIYVDGDVPTYPKIRIDGPITNPYVETDDWRLDINISLSGTDYLEIDLRPWALTVLKNGVQSVAGKLGRRQWLEDMYLKPGLHNIRLGGSSGTGGAIGTVSWRSAWSSF